MALEWMTGDPDGDVDLLINKQLAGWVRYMDGHYEVRISSAIAKDLMPCEEQNFVTLREAMRALKATVTVLLIGREYEIRVDA